MVSAAVKDVDTPESREKAFQHLMATDMTLTSILDSADVLHESEALFDDRPQEENHEEVASEDIPCEEVEECPWEGEDSKEEDVAAAPTSSTDAPETSQAIPTTTAGISKSLALRLVYGSKPPSLRGWHRRSLSQCSAKEQALATQSVFRTTVVVAVLCPNPRVPKCVS
eukprot:3497498-Amphidinium_carterae.1